MGSIENSCQVSLWFVSQNFLRKVTLLGTCSRLLQPLPLPECPLTGAPPPAPLPNQTGRRNGPDPIDEKVLSGQLHSGTKTLSPPLGRSPCLQKIHFYFKKIKKKSFYVLKFGDGCFGKKHLFPLLKRNFKNYCLEVGGQGY